jgi:hypothetical protein
MQNCTVSLPFPTGLLHCDRVEFSELTKLLSPLWDRIRGWIGEFFAGPITPGATHEFENTLASLLRKIGREIVTWVYNRIEAEHPAAAPRRIVFDGESYRRKPKSRNRHLGTLFGTIVLDRFLYEPLEPGERSIFPLEINLGVEARNATPALAARVGELAASSTQSELLSTLVRDHAVSWSVGTLRKVTASLSAGMSPHLHEAQVSRVLDWLGEASASKGRHKPVLSVGRDGIFVPIRNKKGYKEGAVATISVYNRQGRRLGTMYQAQMPEAGQPTLSRELTKLIEEVLGQWEGRLPRLSYVTDAGHHPTEYYNDVLSQMRHPRRPGQILQWTRVVDFYHASEYVGKLSAALFGETREAHAWARKMCKWLKHKPNAVFRVLHSAAKHNSERRLSRKDRQTYRSAYGYLQNHKAFMDYAEHQRRGLPIGSGVTEAGCKTVFTQRFKQSGMSWHVEDGQIILDLRVIRLSKLWTEVHQSYLASKPLVDMPTKRSLTTKTLKKAA